MTIFSIFRVMVLGAALALSGNAFAQQKDTKGKVIAASHFAIAKELVGQVQLAKSLDVFVPQLGIRLLNNVTRTRPELKKDLDAVLDKVVPELEKEKVTLIDRIAVFFTEAMTEDEIKKVVEFNKTPAGKKFLEQQPKVLDRMVVVIDDWNRDISTRMLEMVRAEMKKKGHDL